MNKIYFRADGNSQIGLGHLVRSLALAQMLEKEFLPHFLIQNPAPEISSMIREQAFELTPLAPATDYLGEAEYITTTILEEGDLLVLDGYHFDNNYQGTLRKKKIGLIFIDDLQAFSIPADMVLNQAGGVNKNNYQVRPEARLCLGPDYALLRKPFIRAARRLKSITQVNRLFINMGGADPNNDTCKVLNQVLSQDPSFYLEVVTGSAYRHQEALTLLVSGLPQVKLHQNLSALQMCELMDTCQAAILPPSSIAYEWCCSGGLLFLHQTADNQQAMRDFLIGARLGLELKQSQDLENRETLFYLATEQIIRQQKYFNGQSPANILAEVRRLYRQKNLHLRMAQAKDMLTLYDWINDPEVRVNSFNPEPIPFTVHQIWFENKLQDPACRIFMAQVGQDLAGMIRFDLQQDKATISYLITPDFRGQGLGNVLLEKGESLLLKLNPEIAFLVGYVQQDNIASVVSFQKNHYSLSPASSETAPGSLAFVKALK